MKKVIFLILAFCLTLTMASCGKTRTVTCDHCGEAITIPDTSNITEEWIVYCKTCELALFGEDGVVQPG